MNIEAFTKAVALDVASQYHGVDYLSLVVGNAIERHQHLIESEAKVRIKELETEQNRIAEKIHYPGCWDTAAYPTLADAVCEITHCDPDQCQLTGNITNAKE